jgi:hypothetical protein
MIEVSIQVLEAQQQAPSLTFVNLFKEERSQGAAQRQNLLGRGRGKRAREGES